MSYNTSADTGFASISNQCTERLSGYLVKANSSRLQGDWIYPILRRPGSPIRVLGTATPGRMNGQYAMIGSDLSIEEIELDASEIEELDRLAEETRECGIPWEDLKAELGL